MKNIKERIRITITNSSLRWALIALITLGACTNLKHPKRDHLCLQSAKESFPAINADDLLGSWLDQSRAKLHFTMFKDGKARSDNMSTLVYQQWRLDNAKLILTSKSIGNGTSFVGEDVYDIKALTSKKMILQKGDYTFEFVKRE